MGDTVEDGSYLGLPLIILSAAFVVWRWRLGIVRFAAAMATVATVLSVGPDLTIDTHETGVPLPMALFDHLPLGANFVDARFALYTALFVVVILAVGADRWRSGQDHVLDDQVRSLRARQLRRRSIQVSRRRAVLADPIGAHPTSALALLTAALGPPVHVGGIDLWRLHRH